MNELNEYTTKWLRQFDYIWDSQGGKSSEGYPRVIKKFGSILTIDDFLKIKFLKLKSHICTNNFLPVK